MKATFYAVVLAVLPYLDVAGLVTLAWYSATGAINTVLDKYTPHSDDEWALWFEQRPRTAALVNFLRTSGFNPLGAWRSFRSFLSGGPPAALVNFLLRMTGRWQVQKKVDVTPEVDALKAEIDDLKRKLTEAAKVAGTLACLVWMSVALSACGSQPPPALQTAQQVLDRLPVLSQNMYRLSLDACFVHVDKSNPAQQDIDTAAACVERTQAAWRDYWLSLGLLDQVCDTAPIFCKE